MVYRLPTEKSGGSDTMFTEQSLRDHPALVKAFTGLPAETFWALVEQIEVKMPEYERQRHERPDRQRAIGAGRPYDQPLVIRVALSLTYLRLHIPQEAVGWLYGATQSDVSRELRRLLPLMAQMLPAPEVWKVVDESLTQEEVLELVQLADGRVLVDATEQPVYRSQDNEIRKQYYSGKKKAFTLKTQFVTDGQHHIVAISETVPGAMHDKKLSDEVATLAHFPDGCEVNADKGYQGLDKQVSLITIRNIESMAEDSSRPRLGGEGRSGPGRHGEEEQVPRLKVHLPFKKPKGGELTEEQKGFNRQLSSIRVRVEHCIGWVKNWAIIGTRFRCAHAIYTLVMEVVCGLVNEQTERWQAAKTSANCE